MVLEINFYYWNTNLTKFESINVETFFQILIKPHLACFVSELIQN